VQAEQVAGRERVLFADEFVHHLCGVSRVV